MSGELRRMCHHAAGLYVRSEWPAILGPESSEVKLKLASERRSGEPESIWGLWLPRRGLCSEIERAVKPYE
ncbi:hypothetical protein T440DRAFT_464888 [Plenodomus tracheiphilus IPT5]|uniref:Uncharacterized protein n=1 Tax=Plenodomus tracheiphilus IPT5 TaxID=1408161 RepID=A0A6A7BH44_9PLEO|nr:hypothetical protein T440DRAFT_464888 [Plenodomus tracheiphilus IPT5]